MPRTNVPVTTMTGSAAGIAPVTEVAADTAADPNGMLIPSYSEHMWLEVTCTVAGPVTITFKTPDTVKGRPIGDDTASLSGAGTKRRFGPFDKAVYGPDLQINVSAAGLTLAAYQTALQ